MQNFLNLLQKNTADILNNNPDALKETAESYAALTDAQKQLVETSVVTADGMNALDKVKDYLTSHNGQPGGVNTGEDNSLLLFVLSTAVLALALLTLGRKSFRKKMRY
ncbi:hypothetical protein SDC9_184340 [bioreactor metagenome]|uniref:Uncharacterized protein n=1 Tax=bioreactor metagenome TaxID=1076179 RepID=A0A645HCR7_9ZZZZ